MPMPAFAPVSNPLFDTGALFATAGVVLLIGARVDIDVIELVAGLVTEGVVAGAVEVEGGDAESVVLEL